MPDCFAYGSNLDREAMSLRCPHAVPLGPATLAHHRFFIMANGYASVRPHTGSVVHGLLWTIPAADIPALDDYEDVAGGLYTKEHVMVTRPDGSLNEALMYLGATTAVGQPTAAYMRGIIAAATDLGFPAAYRRELLGWTPRAG